MKIEYHQTANNQWRITATLQNEPTDQSTIRLGAVGATKDQAKDNLITELLFVLDDFETLFNKLDS